MDMKEIMSSLDAFLSAVIAGYIINENTCKNAAKYGALDVLKWLKANNKFNAGADICEIAAIGVKNLDNNNQQVDEKKQFEVLKWLKTVGYTVMDDWTIMAAIKCGNSEIVNMLMDDESSYPWEGMLCEATIRYNRIELIKFIIDYRDMSSNKWLCTTAAQYNRLEILKILHAEGCPLDAESCILAATKNHHTEIIEWLQNMASDRLSEPPSEKKLRF